MTLGVGVPVSSRECVILLAACVASIIVMPHHAYEYILLTPKRNEKQKTHDVVGGVIIGIILGTTVGIVVGIILGIIVGSKVGTILGSIVGC